MSNETGSHAASARTAARRQPLIISAMTAVSKENLFASSIGAPRSADLSARNEVVNIGGPWVTGPNLMASLFVPTPSQATADLNQSCAASALMSSPRFSRSSETSGDPAPLRKSWLHGDGSASAELLRSHLTLLASLPLKTSEKEKQKSDLQSQRGKAPQNDCMLVSGYNASYR